MYSGVDVIYVYDGSYEGFLCCVYESVYEREMPMDICAADELQPTLFRLREIEHNEIKARKVIASIPKKIGPDAASLAWNTFLSCAPHRELTILNFLLFGYKMGKSAPSMIAHPVVAPLYAAQKSLLGEAHLLKGFARFTQADGVLVCTIKPKNFVLPYLRSHFCSRFRNDDFLIFDRTHSAALIYQRGRSEIVSIEDFTPPAADEAELGYRALWKQFYNTIAIEARENPRCRVTHCPKRYWSEMLELEGEQNKTQNALPPSASRENVLDMLSRNAAPQSVMIAAGARREEITQA